VAIGDAAVACDPLSSQGIFIALYTGMLATTAVNAELSGGVGAVETYATQVETIAHAYQRNLATFYGLEQRWRHRPFWRRRTPVYARS
jgi:flavin-dependent dehydrogenase